ncbi:hypothetical protein, partial [Anaplasma bovis]|uniref:hypothetical protein n=1 Tax=Anaplasma bovis TaxID=186733 RepID=UPI002FF10994
MGQENVLDDLNEALAKDDVSTLNSIIRSLSKDQQAILFCRDIFHGRPIVHHALSLSPTAPNLKSVQYLLKNATADVLRHIDKHGASVHYLALKAGAQYTDALLGNSKIDWSMNVDRKNGNTIVAKVLAEDGIAFDRETLTKIVSKSPEVLHKVNNLGENVFHAACSSKNMEALLYCMDAVTLGKTNRVKDLLTMLESRNVRGETPLHLICSNFSLEDTARVLNSLKDSDGRIKADLLIKDAEGKSPIQRALAAAVESNRGNTTRQQLRAEDRKIVTDLQASCDLKLKGEIAATLLEKNLRQDFITFLENITDRDEVQELLHECGRILLNDPARMARTFENGREKGNSLILEKDIDEQHSNWETLFATKKEKLEFVSYAAANEFSEVVHDYVERHINADNRDAVAQLIVEKIFEHANDPYRAVERLQESLPIVPFEKEFAVSLIDKENITAQALEFVLKHSNAAAAAEIRREISSRIIGESSVLRNVIESTENGAEIRNLLDAAFKNSPGDAGKNALMRDLEHYTIELAQQGNYDKISTLLEFAPQLIYCENSAGKNLVEISSEYGQKECVRMLIEFHKTMVNSRLHGLDQGSLCIPLTSIASVAAISPREGLDMLDTFISSGSKISEADGQKLLSKVSDYGKEDFRNTLDLHFASQMRENDRIIDETVIARNVGITIPTAAEIGSTSRLSAAEELAFERLDLKERKSLEFQNYGVLHRYAQAVKKSEDNSLQFKRDVLDNLKNVKDFSHTSLDNGEGHSIFSIVAALGTPEQMDALLRHYEKVRGSPVSKHPDPDRISSFGSSLQCALRAENGTMADHLLKEIRDSSITTQYGKGGENLLHTILQSRNVGEVLSPLMLTNTSFSSSVLKALQQENADGQTPIDIALSSNVESQSAFFAFVRNALSRSDTEILLGSTDTVEKVLENSVDTFPLECIFDMEDNFNSNEKSSRRLSVLGSTDNMTYLLGLACKNPNPDLVDLMLKKIRKCIENKALIDATKEVKSSKEKLNAEAFDREVQSRAVIKVVEGTRELLLSFIESNSANQAVFDSIAKKSALRSEHIEQIIEAAIRHDNPDLLGCINVEHASANVDTDRLLSEGKDNMMRCILENITSEAYKTSDAYRELLSKIATTPSMSKSRQLCRHEIRGLLDSATLRTAIESQDLSYILEITKINRSLIAQPIERQAGQPAILPYDLALATYPDNKDLAAGMASATIQFALERLESEDPTFALSEQDVQKLSDTVTRILIRDNGELGLTSDEVKSLTPYVNMAAQDLFRKESMDPAKGLLREALLRGNLEIANRLLDVAYGRREAGASSEITFSEEHQQIINLTVEGRSLLHLGALSGDYGLLQRLCDMGGDPIAVTDRGENLAHLCAQSGMKTHAGEYAFAKMIREDARLRTVDAKQQGTLIHAARCENSEDARRMLEHIVLQDPSLDTNIASLSPEARAKYVSQELRTIAETREDYVVDDFLDDELGYGDEGRKKLTESLRKACKDKTVSMDKVARMLVHDSERSFKEINPLSTPQTVIANSRKTFFSQQDALFNIVDNMNISRDEFITLSRMPIDVFTTRDPVSHLSPVDKAISTGNVGFLKYFLQERAAEVNPALRDARGSNLVLKLTHLIADNSSVRQDRDFMNMYAALVEHSHCITKSGNNTVVQSVLDRVEGRNGEILRGIAERAAANEYKLYGELQDLEDALARGYDSTIAGRFANIVSTYREFSRVAVNPWRTLCSHILSDTQTVYSGLTDDHRRYLTSFTTNRDLKSLVSGADENGNNPLQSAIKSLISSNGGSSNIGVQRANVLHELCVEISERLERTDPAILEDLFLKSRNLDGNNLLEDIVSLNPSHDIFITLESKLGKDKISKFCDLNTVLVASAGQNALQKHICSNYSVSPIGNRDIHGNIRVHNAVISGDLDAFTSVMMTGGNINQLDDRGNTPLHVLLNHMLTNEGTLKEGHFQILKILVARGAPLHHKNSEGLSPCDIAKFLRGSAFGADKNSDCIRYIADSRLEYLNLKEKIAKEVAKGFIVHKEKSSAGLQSSDISGATLDLQVGTGATLLISKMLDAKLCSDNSITSANLNFNDGKDIGHVEKIGNKRNYTVSSGSLKLDLSWKPPRGKVQKVSVIVDSDGTIQVHKSSKHVAPNGENLDFANCRVFIGGLPLQQALYRGRWREAAIDSPAQGEGMDLNRASEIGIDPFDNGDTPGNRSQQAVLDDRGHDGHDHSALDGSSTQRETMDFEEDTPTYSMEGAAGGSVGKATDIERMESHQAALHRTAATTSKEHIYEQLHTVHTASVESEPVVGAAIQSTAHVVSKAHIHEQQHTVHTASITQKSEPEPVVGAAIQSAAHVVNKAHVYEQPHTAHTASVIRERAQDLKAGDKEAWKGYRLSSSPTPIKLYRELTSFKKGRIDDLLLDVKHLRDTYKAPQEAEMLNSAILYTLCSYADLSYALNGINGNNLNAAVSEILSECRKSVKQGEKEISAETYEVLRNAIPKALSRNGIEYRNVDNPLLEIEDGKIRSAAPIPRGFSSTYGYGRHMDSLIEQAVSEIRDIAERSSLSSSISLRLNDLPLLVLALDNAKTDRGSLPVPEKDSGPIPQADGMVLLKHIYNMSSVTGATWRITKVAAAKSQAEELGLGRKAAPIAAAVAGDATHISKAHVQEQQHTVH